MAFFLLPAGIEAQEDTGKAKPAEITTNEEAPASTPPNVNEPGESEVTQSGDSSSVAPGSQPTEADGEAGKAVKKTDESETREVEPDPIEKTQDAPKDSKAEPDSKSDALEDVPSQKQEPEPTLPTLIDFESLLDTPEKRTPHLKKDKGGVPLLLDGKEVFRIRAALGAYTPDVRVESIKQRIKSLEEDPKSKEYIQEITTKESGYSTNIVAGTYTLFTVTDPDAEAEGYDSRQELALDYAYLLKDALVADMKLNSIQTFFMGLGLTILTTVALFFLVKAVNWIFRQSYLLLERWRGTVIRPLKIQQAELLSAASITDLISGFIRVIRIIIFVSIISIYLSFVLSYFPATKPIAQEGINLLLRPIAGVVWPAIVSYTPNLLFILFILVSTYYVIAFTHYIFREIRRGTIQIPGFERDWSMPTYKIARFLIIAFALILLFPYLPGAGSPAFQQVSIFLGVLFSLASTGALSHVIAGVFLTYTGALKLGNRVKIADTVGDVVEQTLLATKIKTIKNEIITIPNGLVLGNHIVNYSASAKTGGLILHTSVTIGYDVPWQKVHEAMIQAAKETEFVQESPEPFVWQKELGDFSVNYEINAYTEHPDKMGKIYADIHMNIQEQFNKRGIEILSPTYSAIRDGNRVTIPEEDLASDYEAPAFNLNFVGGPPGVVQKKSK